MAQHKAPTAVTIAPTSEKSALARWVEKYWVISAAVALAAAGFILYSQHSSEEHEVTNDESWNQLLAIAKPDPVGGGMSGSPKELQQLGASLGNQQAGPWALYLAATNALQKHEYEVAASSLSQIRSSYPSHPLVTDVFGDERLSAVGVLEKRLASEKSWREAHPALFANPTLLADAPRVRLVTEKGAIVVGLYSERAPKHVENFLKLAREAVYDGGRFHRVKAGQFIQAGDPNSKTDDVTTWGMGGPGYKIDREVSELRHFEGALAAAKMGGDQQSSGSQFYICTTPQHQFDSDYVVFGTVVEGLDVAKLIDQGTVVAGTDRPEQPVKILSAEVISG